MEKTKRHRQHKVTACLSDETKAKLEKICEDFDLPMSWVISRLIWMASADHLQVIFGGGKQ